MQVHSVGIDLGKTTFRLVALGVADGSRGMHCCADVSERATWEIRHLTGCK